MNELSPSGSERRDSTVGRCIGLVAIGIIFLFYIFHGTATVTMKRMSESLWMQQSRTIALALFCYSNDHNQNYPDGKSSTEAFQKLIDEGYVSDPTVFYLPLRGKIKPAIGQKKLRPENVGWDMTAPLGAGDSDEIPVVFMTGYKVIYLPDGPAIPIVKPFPPYKNDNGLLQWLNGAPPSIPTTPGIPVTYKSNSAAYKILNLTQNPDGTIPHFIPPGFNPQGKTYRQLTPDGTLP